MAIDTAKLYNFYLWLVSFVAIIAIWINLWLVLTSVWKYYLITDEEYLQNRESYRLEQCENNTIYNKEVRLENNVEKTTEQTVKKTKEEIEECKQKARNDVIMSRKYDLKDMFISSFAWMIVFLILFGFHYPKFLKNNKT